MEHLPMHLSVSKIMTCICVLCRICKRFGFTCIVYYFWIGFFSRVSWSNGWYYTILSIINWSNKSFSSFCLKRWSDRTDFHLNKVHFLFTEQIGFWIHWHVYSMHRWHGKHANSIKTCWNACLFILMLNVHVNLFT